MGGLEMVCRAVSFLAQRPEVKNQRRSRTTRPPSVASHTWLSEFSRSSFAGDLADHAALVIESRSDPESSLPPDLVMVETTPPLKRPYSAEMAPVITVVSRIPSSTYIGRICPRTFSVTATPLMSTRLDRKS